MITVYVDVPFEEYKECFVRNYHNPYIIQQEHGLPWTTVNKCISDNVISDHLQGTLWAGVRAPWYITWGILDIDNPKNNTIQNVIEHLQMRESEYMLITSPSFFEDDSVHILIKPVYHQALTAKRYHKIFSEILQGEFSGIEIFPDITRGVRLPFGKNQLMIDCYGFPIHNSWQERLYWFLKLDPFDISRLEKKAGYLSSNISSMFPTRSRNEQKESQALYHNGLQRFGTRHNATLSVAYFLLRRGNSQDETRQLMRNWIREHHNGFSQEVNRGNFRLIDKEIDDAIEWNWNRYTKPTVLGNKDNEFLVCECDIPFIGECFPGDVVNQKRLFKLIGFARPRQHFEDINCSQKTWIKIAGRNNYLSFIRKLEDEGIISRSTGYRVGVNSKSIRIKLPDATQSNPIMKVGRYVTDYSEAVRVVYPTAEQAISILKLSQSTASNWYKNGSSKNTNTYKDSQNAAA